MDRNKKEIRVGDTVAHIYDRSARIVITSAPQMTTLKNGRQVPVNEVFYGHEAGVHAKPHPFLFSELMVIKTEEELEDMGMDWDARDERRWSQQ